ncbi:MAG TPA: DUF2085 domain-containing protein [Terracidiphilus sp.]
MNSLRFLFSFVCGQQHCWVLGGFTLPLCQRCTGLYVGASCAFLLVLLFRPRPGAFLYSLHGFFMLFMFPFGFHFVAHGALMRTFTGALFAFGLVYYLALNPLTHFRAWKPESSSRVISYLAAVAVSIVLLLRTVQAGGEVTAIVLSSLAIAGLAVLTLLTAANLVVLPATVRALRAFSILSAR